MTGIGGAMDKLCADCGSSRLEAALCPYVSGSNYPLCVGYICKLRQPLHSIKHVKEHAVQIKLKEWTYYA